MGMTTGILNLFCALQSLILIVCYQLDRRNRRMRSERIFFVLMTVVSVMLLSAGVALTALEAHPLPFSLLMTLAQVCAFIVQAIFSSYAVDFLRLRAPMRTVVLIGVRVVAFVCAAAYVVNLFYPFLYDFATRAYVNRAIQVAIRLSGFAASLLIVAGAWIGGRNRLRDGDLLYLTVAPIVPFTSLIFEAAIPGLDVLFPLIFLAMMVRFIRISFSVSERMQRKMDLAEKDRVMFTMERIKPHYIYNVLTSIYYLCDRDVNVAKSAIQIFTEYLRDALSTMEDRTLIPFQRELRTVRNYLELEKMRFGDQIRVSYDIRTDAFELPPFTLQPLVENSVKHGLANTGAEGEIRISGFERDDAYYVMVQDSYGGFEQTEEGGEGSGTRYIREILDMTVNGTLQIRSEPGKGTTSVICIPKKNKKK